jgi:ABC-type polysaccharide/polyol phosphate export permease
MLSYGNADWFVWLVTLFIVAVFVASAVGVIGALYLFFPPFKKFFNWLVNLDKDIVEEG